MTQHNTAVLDSMLDKGQAESEYWSILTDPTRTSPEDKDALTHAMTVLGFSAQDVEADLAALTEYRDLPARERAEESEAKAAEKALEKAGEALSRARADIERRFKVDRLAKLAEVDEIGKKKRQAAELLQSGLKSANDDVFFHRQQRGQLRKAANENPRIRRFLERQIRILAADTMPTAT